MRFTRLLAVAAVLVTVPAAHAFVAQTSAATDVDRTVCKRQQKTGTRFPTKTCRTAREWAEIEEAHKRQGAEMMNRPTIATRSNRPGE